MPSHTFTRVGYWKESVDTNVTSEQTALKRNAIGEALHAMDYEAYAYLQMARDRRRRAVAQRMPDVLAKLDVTAMGGAAPPGRVSTRAAAIPARYALERGAWAEAAALHASDVTVRVRRCDQPFRAGFGAARSGKPAAASADVAQLAALRDRLAAAKDDTGASRSTSSAGWRSRGSTFAEGRRTEAIDCCARRPMRGRDRQVRDPPGPLAPARELLGEMLLEAGNARDALVAFEATMKKEPSRFRGVYGAARAAEAAGNKSGRGEVRPGRWSRLRRTRTASGPELKRARSFTN